MVPLPRTKPTLLRNRDFLAGLLLFTFGVRMIFFRAQLSAARRGPGYFPMRLGIWVRMLRGPYRGLFPSIIMFCCIGNYSASNNAFDLYLCAFISVLGYVLLKLECEAARC